VSILFCGAEMDDVSASGTVTFASSASAAYRSAYSRGYISCAAGNNLANYVTAALTASSLFSVTARGYSSNNFTADRNFLWLSSGGAARLRLKVNGAAPATITLETWNGSAATALATSTATITSGTLYRFDVVVNYAVSGRVRVYIDQVLCIDYSGNVTAGGSTTLDAVNLSLFGSTAAGYWSEVIVSTQDSRSLVLKTLVEDATGDLAQWTGTWSDIDEPAASETDVMYSGASGQESALNCTGMPAGASGLSILGVKISASACCGVTGPQGLQLGIRQSGTSSHAASHTLTSGYTTVSDFFATNPVTGAAFTPAEIDNLQLAFKSVT